MTWWDRLTDHVVRTTGGRATFAANVGLVILWLGIGPLTGWSDRWQLWANTATTIITYLMVFLIQHAQNKSDAATHLKLDELIRHLHGPRNEVAGADRQGEQEIERLRDEV